MAAADVPPNYIRAWRKAKGFTQEQLGERIGTNGSVVSLLERGERPLTDEWLGKLADALETTRGTLLDRPPGPEAQILHFWSAFSPQQRDTIVRVAEGLSGWRADDKASG